MTTAQPPQKPAAPPRSGRRFLVVAVVLIVLFGGLLTGGIYFYQRNAADTALREALDETDRLDPGWRLKDIQAARAVIPDQENAALHALAVVKLLPRDWGAKEEFYRLFEDLPAEVQLSPAQVKALRAELARAGAGLAEARKMKDFQRGRFFVAYTDDWISSPSPYQQVRLVASVLEHDALMRSQEKDADGALESCRAILNCGRAVGDEPGQIPQLVRIAMRNLAAGRVERTLAQGQPSATALKELLRLLQDEEAQPLLLIGVRGERAGIDRLVESIQNGKVSAAKLGGVANPGGQQENVQLPGIEYGRAALLRYLNQLVEAAKLPAPRNRDELRKSEKQLEQSAREEHLLLALLAPAASRIAESHLRNQAQLRCAMVGVAAELHRLERGGWPDTPDKLVAAGYLKGVPADPFDGKSLRWRPSTGCVRIYSVGPDGVDNGGVTLLESTASGNALVFRLWDVERRRRLPLPPRPVPEQPFPLAGGPGDEPGPPRAPPP